MKISLNTMQYMPSFKGTTPIRAVTDSHQEARKECELLSKIADDAKKQNNILLLNCGDLFGGVYSRDLMKDLYLQFKKSNPNVEIVMTIGNNDPISGKDKYVKSTCPFGNTDSIDYLKQTIREFEENDINVVCANLTDKQTGEYPDWIQPYKVVERDGDRIFVTGFCIDRLPSSLGVNTMDQVSAFKKLQKYIDAEKPDSIIVLNHDYGNTSQALYDYAKSKGIKIDLIIGGHDHDNPDSDTEKNIYCPKAFSSSMFEMDLKIKDKISKLINVREINSGNLPVNKDIEQIITPYERESKILEPVTPHVLNLPKKYAHPGPLGTFIADGMKEMTGTDAAFFASNVVRVPLYYEENKDILNYNLRKIITFDSTVQKAEFTPDELKEILTSAVKDRLRLGEQNARFLQCSNNIRIEGRGNSKDKSYYIKQIYLNDEPLLDEEGNAIDPDRKISCAFDNFIPTDGRSTSLTNADKEDVIVDGKKLRLDTVLRESLKNAEGKYEPGTTYPSFVLDEIIE